MWKSIGNALAVVAACACAAAASADVVIDTVTVGNPGNPADTRYATPGYGSVDYTYNIGKYEVTVGQYAAFLNAVAAVDTYGLYNTNMAHAQNGCGISRNGSSGSYTYDVDAAFVNRPVTYVSYWGACRFTNWLHNNQPTGAQGPGTTETGTYTLSGYNGSDGRTIQRNADWRWAVTSEDEWYKAAYHNNDGVAGNYWDYPTSSNSVPGRDLNDASGNNANYYGDPSPIQSPYYTTIVGEFENSDSPYDTFDQGGNMWEWNESVISGSYRGLRGGSYSSNQDRMRASYRYNSPPSYGSINFGFRVSAVPEPASMLMLALAGVGLIRRR